MHCKFLYKSKQAGLTLIELLISLVIISIVITLCANGFKFGNRVWEKVDAEQAYLDETVTTQRFLRKIISEAIFYPLLEEDSLQNEYFTGNSENLIFLAPSPQYGLDDYLYIYEIFKQKNGDSYDLGLRYLPANSYFSGIKNNADRNVKLMRKVKNIKFKYYGVSKRTRERAWFNSWIQQDELPSLISIDIEPEDSLQIWPTLIAETKFGVYRAL